MPAGNCARDAGHLAALDRWLRSYKPASLFDAQSGSLLRHLAELAPAGNRRMSANPHANGGELVIPLALPSPGAYAVDVPSPGCVECECTSVLGRYLAEVFRLNEAQANFRVMCPDELTSNKLGAVLEATGRMAMWDALPGDESTSREGRVMEVLSEHCCEGWLEGYTLTGRHGLFPTCARSHRTSRCQHAPSVAARSQRPPASTLAAW